MTFFTDDMRRDPFPLYEQLRARSPVFQVQRGGPWLLLGHDDVKRALTDHETFSSAVSAPPSLTAEWLVFTDPPRHTLLRALINRAFTPRAIAGLEGRIRAISKELLDAVVPRGALDLVADYALPLPLGVIAELLGAPIEDRPQLRAWSDVILGLADSAAGTPQAESAERAFAVATAAMRGYVRGLIEARRAAPTDDLLTRLVQAELDGARLTEDEILAFFQVLLVAGHETTTNLISNAILCFLDHPDQRARLAAEPALLPSAIEEVLRYRTPVQAVFRLAHRDVPLHGQVIPAGALVFAMLGAANRDPARVPDPARFDIARDPNPHVGFGHGIHFCLGAPLSRLEARIAIPDLLERLPDLALAGDAPWPPREAFHVHGPSSLRLAFRAV